VCPAAFSLLLLCAMEMTDKMHRALSHCSQSIEYFARATLMRRARQHFSQRRQRRGSSAYYVICIACINFFVRPRRILFSRIKVIESLGALQFLFVPLSGSDRPVNVWKP